MANELENANPVVYRSVSKRHVLPEENDDSVVDKFDTREVFGILCVIGTMFTKSLSTIIAAAPRRALNCLHFRLLSVIWAGKFGIDASFRLPLEYRSFLLRYIFRSNVLSCVKF